MNAIALTTNPTVDYRAAMQEAAVAHLYRHREQHLAGDDQVLANCKHYLSQSLEVPAHLVQRIAELAVAQFESMTSKRLTLLGVCPGSSLYRPSLMLLDTLTQQRYPIPARYLPRNMLQPRSTSK